MPEELFRPVCQTPEIYAIDVPLPDNPLRNLNCYVLKSEGQMLVVDTGFNRPECAAALDAGLKALGAAPNTTTLFLTHLHSDHTGLVERFVQQGCTVYMNGTDHDIFRGFQTSNTRFLGYAEEGFPVEELALQTKTNQAAVYSPRSVYPVTRVQHGTTFAVGCVQCQCVETPGHTPGHTCLYLPQYEIMFVGDCVLFDITPNITVWRAAENSLKSYLESLDKLAAYKMKMALPAHRTPSKDVYERIAELKAHHARRLENTLRIVGENEGLTAYEIAAFMKWKMRGRDWSEFPPQQKWFAVGETIAHLDYLRLAGKLRRAKVGSVYRYWLA